jgi:hypothetical protein
LQFHSLRHGATFLGLQNFRPLIGFECGAKLRNHLLARWQMRFLYIQNSDDGISLQCRYSRSTLSVCAGCVADDIDQTIDCMQTT